MTFETVCTISFRVLDVLAFGVPAWLIFYPPRRLRELSFWYRPVLAFFVAEAGTYALFYGFVYPECDAIRHASDLAHPGSTLFLDGILMIEPSKMWRLSIIVILLFLVLRRLYLAWASRRWQATPKGSDPDQERQRS